MDVNQTIVKALEDIGVSYVFGGSLEGADR